MTATAIIGAQWGSEGKGVVAAAMAHRFKAAVRVGGPNAGHSLWFNGRVWKMRGVPCAWINPEAKLYIGAGAVVDIDLLARELSELPDRVQIVIDEGATLVDHDNARQERDARLGEAIGSTLEGVGAARMEKMWRSGSPLVGQRLWDPGPPWDRITVVPSVSALLYGHITDNEPIMLEGTQGSGLSLHHGQWPYVTSADTNVAQLLADAGIAPKHLEHTYLVARTFPIRVGGHSGPMGEEMDWADLPVDKPERTTVTNKQRRIAKWSWPVVEAAVRLNGPCGLFLTFADYLDPSIRGEGSQSAVLGSNAVYEFVNMVEDRLHVPVIGIGTGGERFSLVSTGRCLHMEGWR